MAKKFIAGAIKHPGALHKDLGVPQGQKIPVGKLAAAAKKGGKVGQRARFAETLKGEATDAVVKLLRQFETNGSMKSYADDCRAELQSRGWVDDTEDIAERILNHKPVRVLEVNPALKERMRLAREVAKAHGPRLMGQGRSSRPHR